MERDALLALYRSTDGDNWRRKTNWGTDAPLSDWYGVKVNAEGRVVRLDLSFNNLKGIFTIFTQFVEPAAGLQYARPSPRIP